MEQRLIDANALDDSFRHSIIKCKQWFEDAAVIGEEESKARAEQAYVTFMECSMRLKKQPTVDAVPIDFLKQFAEGKRGYYSDFVIEAVEAYKRRTDGHAD